jgi:hypothetical protein
MWDCQHCGTSGNEDGEKCRSCFFLPVPATLILRSKDGAEARLGLTCRLNQAWAVATFGDEGIYWDSGHQLTIERRAEGWFVCPNLDARNETLVDGVGVREPTMLAAGSILAVGREAKKVEKTRLEVSF